MNSSAAIRNAFVKQFRRILRSRPNKIDKHWRMRIDDVISCADNIHIPRHPKAGSVCGDFQIMHNGLVVKTDGYYGAGITQMLRENKGCHEPQEEIIFQAVLPHLSDRARMIELGAYWGFYSMWFLHNHPLRRAWLVEPSHENLSIGIQNFLQNKLHGCFIPAAVGTSGEGCPDAPIIQLDELFDMLNLQHVEILHADIQGEEVNMLKGAGNVLRNKLVDFCFISTHSVDLHTKCVEELSLHDYTTLVDIPPNSSFSFDGVLVASSPNAPVFPIPCPSRRQ